MTFFDFPFSILLTTLILLRVRFSNSQHSCSIFQPFKVTPDNAKFQIGGPFPLHTDDCVHVRPDVVQELIAVQWALSHWNQNPQNANFKLAMSAADTCSREAEGMSQTVTFLNEAGFFLPKECYVADSSRGRTPIGLIMPTMQSRRLKSLKDILSAVQVPLITYSTSSAQALFDSQILTAFSTVPTVDHYMQALTVILKQLKTNHVTLVYSDTHATRSALERQISKLARSGVIVSEILSIDDVTKAKLTAAESSDVVVTMMAKDEFLDFMSSPKIAATDLRKFYVSLAINGESWSKTEIEEFLFYKSTPARLLILQQSTIFDGDQFRAYFLDILRNNYQSYALLGTYMQQMYNCTSANSDGGAGDCDRIDSFDLLAGFNYNRGVESAVLATYAFGALAKAMANDPDEPCSKPGPVCARAATTFLKNRLTFTFGDSDPQAYRGFNLRFAEDRTLQSLKIEGLYVRRDPNFDLDAVLNYTTNNEWAIRGESIKWTDGAPIASWCQPWRAECQKEFCTIDRRFETERMWLQKSGHLYVMGLFDMRKYDIDTARCNNTIDNARSVTMPAAFVYVLETIRQKYPDFDLLPRVELGGILIDACHDSLSSIEPIIAASTDKCLVVAETGERNSTISSTNIAAFASGQKDSQYDTIRFLFGDKGGLRKVLVGSSGVEKSSKSLGDTNLMPDYDSQARLILDLLIRQGWDYVSVLLSEDDSECVGAYEAFRRLADVDDRVCISDVVYARRNGKIESIKSADTPATRVAVSFTTARDTILFLKSRTSYGDGSKNDRPVYIFVGNAHDWESEESKSADGLVSKWNVEAWGAVSIQPRRTVENDFRTFLSTINPKRLPERWFVRFWEDYFQCAVRADKIPTRKKPCTGDEHLPTQFFGRMTREAYFMLGLETLIFALDGIYKQACPEQKGLCDAFFRDGYQEKIFDLIRRTPKIDQQFVIYNYRSQPSGVGYVEIGNWSNSEGLKFGDSWTWYDSEGNKNASLPESNCRPPLCRCHLENDFFKKPMDTTDDDDGNVVAVDRSLSKVLRSSIRKSENGGFDYSTLTIRRQQWKNQSWTYIFLVVNTLLLMAAVLVLGLVCLKLCYRVVKGNQSLGICLLIGVILLYVSVYFFIFDSSELLCRLRYVGHSLAYSICFGVMIAKAVQLRNSETLGFNGYVSYWNYWLLLFFIITVQLALNMQWVIVRDPVLISFLVEGGQSSPSIILHCSWSSEEFLASQIYVVILLSMALFLSLMNRNVKRNYKETRWLMYTSLICAPIWIVWMISFALIPDPFKDTVVVMELITCATVVLCFMFGPKLYILLSYEPVLIEYPPGFKLELGNGGNGGSALEKNHLDSTFPDNNNDFGQCLNFGDDVDDLNEDGQRSVVSANSASTKSTSLSHSNSSASAMTTTSDDSFAPVYQAVVRKKCRSKRVKVDPAQSATTIGSMSPEVAQRRDMAFGETVSSVH